MSRCTPPAPEELEVSIIGPGRGECVLVHLGANEWCVVDSCIPQGASKPAAVEYLASLGTRAVENVRLVVATHWHDDHIRGLASLLGETPRADFFCSAALRSQEFLTLVGAEEVGTQRHAGLAEFAAILGALSKTASSPRAKKLASPGWAIENRRLLDLPQTARPFPVSVTAMSPSDGTLKLAFQEIAELLPKPGDAQRRVVGRSANHASVVLRVQAGPVTVLLGADLEQTGNPGEGWAAVLQCHRGGADPRMAGLFKVPHHGSPNADHPGVWREMLAPNPLAVVTPFNGGRTPLPSAPDMKRMSKRTGELYCTSAGAGKPPARDPMVEKKLREMAVGRRVVEGRAGHVRVRWRLADGSAAPKVELFEGAYKFRGSRR